jgi:hypothetical protein
MGSMDFDQTETCLKGSFGSILKFQNYLLNINGSHLTGD